MYRLLLFLLAFLFFGESKGQVLEPTTIGLAGAGVSYTDGLDALFINPANVFFERKGEKFAIQLPRYAGSLYTPNLFTNTESRRSNLEHAQQYFQAGNAIEVSQFPAYQRFLFRNSRQKYAHYSNESDISWGKLAFKIDDNIFSIGVRTRVSSNNLIARSWFENLPSQLPDSSLTSRGLEFLFNVRHEITLGFASKFTYFSNQFSDLSNLTFGFAPKLILPGTFIRRLHNSTVIVPENGGDPYQTIFSRNYSIGENLPPPNNSGNYAIPENADILREITGLGVGLDLGLSYVFPIGDDFSILNFRASDAYVKGIRLSIAVRDLGVIKYDKNIMVSTGSIDSASYNPNISSSLPYIFQGNIGATDAAISNNENEARINDSLSVQNLETSWYRMPPSIQGGVSLQFERVQLMAEILYRSNDMRLLSESFSGHFALEIRPTIWLPLRLGYQIHQTLPATTSLGAGIDTKYVFANIGFMSYALPRQLSGVDRIVAASASLTVSF